MFTQCSLNVHSMFTQRSLNGHSMFAQCSLSVHSMTAQCSLNEVRNPKHCLHGFVLPAEWSYTTSWAFKYLKRSLWFIGTQKWTLELSQGPHEWATPNTLLGPLSRLGRKNFRHISEHEEYSSTWWGPDIVWRTRSSTLGKPLLVTSALVGPIKDVRSIYVTATPICISNSSWSAPCEQVVFYFYV